MKNKWFKSFSVAITGAFALILLNSNLECSLIAGSMWGIASLYFLWKILDED
jgi:hypothetical protein